MQQDIPIILRLVQQVQAVEIIQNFATWHNHYSQIATTSTSGRDNTKLWNKISYYYSRIVIVGLKQAWANKERHAI